MRYESVTTTATASQGSLRDDVGPMSQIALPVLVLQLGLCSDSSSLDWPRLRLVVGFILVVIVEI